MSRKYYHREKKILCTEQAPSEKKLIFLYTTFIGRILLKLIFSANWYSYLTGKYYSTAFSKNKAQKFIKDYNIDLSHCVKKEFTSFNDFFTRIENRKINCNPTDVISPCDGLLSCYKIDENLKLNIKGRTYSLAELLKNSKYKVFFKGGTCLMYRLTLTDYHRYIYNTNGRIIENLHINGSLHTVRPINGSNHNFFENSRNITILDTDAYGVIAQIEVGAMLVGKITNHKKSGTFKQFEEKGFFEYGGSTIIQLYAKEKISIDADISNFTKDEIETKVKLGEKIACSNNQI